MFKGVSLFSGAGIGEFYLKEVGIDIKIANEIIKKRADLYKYFYPDVNVICGDIKNVYSEILNNSLKENCDFVLATPPCQGMSVAGKKLKNDPRNNLIIEVVKFIKDLKPKYVIIENVPAFFKTKIIIENKEITIKDFLLQNLGNDYNLNMGILDASDYGTPQIRKRAIVLISDKKYGI